MRTASCKAVEPKISAYVDGEIPVALREEVEAHLARCEGCARMAASFREIHLLASSQAIPAVAPAEWALFRDDLQRRAETALGARVIRGKAFRRWTLAAAAAVVLIGVACAWLLTPKAKPLESFAEFPDGKQPAAVQVDEDTLYIKYEDF